MDAYTLKIHETIFYTNNLRDWTREKFVNTYAPYKLPFNLNTAYDQIQAHIKKVDASAR